MLDIVRQLNGEKPIKLTYEDRPDRKARAGSECSGMSQNCNFDISDNEEESERGNGDFIRDSRDLTSN